MSGERGSKICAWYLAKSCSKILFVNIESPQTVTQYPGLRLKHKLGCGKTLVESVA